MSLTEMMMSDDEYDSKPTDELVLDAARLPVSERARSLFALSKRVTVETMPAFRDLLELEQNQQPLMFGTLPVRSAAIIALLVNGVGDVRAEAERLWFAASFVERHDLVVTFEADGVDLPLLSDEHALLEHGRKVANERFGAGEWVVRPTSDGQAAVVKATLPDKRVIFVDVDGSVLLADGYDSLWDAELAFLDGVRTPSETANA